VPAEPCVIRETADTSTGGAALAKQAAHKTVRTKPAGPPPERRWFITTSLFQLLDFRHTEITEGMRSRRSTSLGLTPA
jgi:hypothetical protein